MDFDEDMDLQVFDIVSDLSEFYRQRMAVGYEFAGLTPNKPATLANSKISPLGTVLFWMASMVSFLETLTTAVAMALRSVKVLCVISTIYNVCFHSF